MNWILDIEELNVEFLFGSNDSYMCVCEFHDDTHPSMNVNVAEDFYYCFACGEFGDIDTLIGVTGGVKKWIPDTIKRRGLNDEWRKILMCDLAYDDEYLVGRGVTNEQIERFQIRVGNGQIIFPLFEDNRVCGVKIRFKTPTSKVKYLTFGKMPTYYSNVLPEVPLDMYEEIFVTEGIFGLLALDNISVPVITPLSVNRVMGLKNVFNKYPQVNFNLMLDPDVAGYMATAKGISIGSGFGNVFGMNVLIDIDFVSNEALMEIIDTTGIIGRRSDRPDYFLKQIKRFYGKDIYKDNLSKFLNSLDKG